MRQVDAVASLKKMREGTQKRNFLQSIEMMINFTGLDMKKPQNQISVKVSLPNPTGKGSGKVAVFSKTSDFADKLKGKVDRIIMEPELEGLVKDRAKMAEIMNYDALFAEGAAMLAVAKYLGQQLAPKGKMPKLIPNINTFDEALDKAKTQVTVTNKKGKFMPVVHSVVGRENMDDDKIAQNMVAIYDAVLNALPQKKQNIKNVYIKMTMGVPIKLGDAE